MKRAYRVFRFCKFSVSVPKTVVSTWREIPLDTLDKIHTSVLAVYRKDIAAWKSAKFAPIDEGITAELERKPRSGEPVTKSWERLADRRVKNRVLDLLRYGRFRRWNDSPIRSLFATAVGMAAMDGDAKFFMQLGRRLERNPISFRPPADHSPPAGLLRENWLTHNGLCLCWFSNDALVSLLSIIDKNYSPDAVRKTQERLGLRKLRKPLIRSVNRDGSSHRIVCEIRADK